MKKTNTSYFKWEKKLLDRLYNMCLDSIFLTWMNKNLPPIICKDDITNEEN